MNTAEYMIPGGDYSRGGTASKQLKEALKKIGADPSVVRRTMVAAYEAEMNVVIHARGGTMRVAVDPAQVDVLIIDEGPGIPDIEKAMQEGFSTAPPEARALGFGAGMGLPNIRKNSDRFSVKSVVGRGTQVRFTIFLSREEETHTAAHSVRVTPRRCQQCLACLRVCPTSAMRMRDSSPKILERSCVDCTSCISACEFNALKPRGSTHVPEAREESLLVLPGPFLEQFGNLVQPQTVMAALGDMGFRRICLLEEWEDALRIAAAQYAQEESKVRPVLSPMCPAVVNLIRTRFPSLLVHVAPFLSPVEAARESITDRHAVFMALCPSHCTILRAPNILTHVDLVAPSSLRDVVFPRVLNVPPSTRPEPIGGGTPGVCHVSGMRHVLSVLDQIENGMMNDYLTVELYACDQGCFGSPVWTEDSFVARLRFERFRGALLGKGGGPDATVLRRVSPLRARGGQRLDSDMSKAIDKLAQIDELTRQLPGRNCGVCGAPTCAALAEDIVLGRADLADCAYRNTVPALADEFADEEDD